MGNLCLCNLLHLSPWYLSSKSIIQIPLNSLSVFPLLSISFGFDPKVTKNLRSMSKECKWV